MLKEDALLERHFFGGKPKLLGVFCTFIRNQVNYSAEKNVLVSTLQQKCKGEQIYFFEEEINNYIDIARSTEVGEASKARNDYVHLANVVLQRMSAM